MNPRMVTKQIIDFYRTVFDNAFDNIDLLQNHSEKIIGQLLGKADFFPAKGKEIIMEWIEADKKRRLDFKELLNDNFQVVEGIFVDTANAAGLSVYIFMEKADRSLRNIADQVQLSIVEVMDKSIQTAAAVADKAAAVVREEAIAERKVGIQKA
ncbi:MAG TPA: hypothetical protein PK114_02890 [Smithellaceae bacterium]|nr:hypothetical protein [Smithellaceae bacterium]